MKPKFTYEKCAFIGRIDQFKDFINKGYDISCAFVSNIDFSKLNIHWNALNMERTTFAGCTFRSEDYKIILDQGAIIFPEPHNLPFDPYRSSLYSYEELSELMGTEDRDLNIYEYFTKYRFSNNIQENLWQRIHDHAIDSALTELLKEKSDENNFTKAVGIMGGHSMPRDTKEFLDCALLTQQLAKAGYFIITGGGPGIMEAANLGAYMKNYDKEDLEIAIDIMKKAPGYESDRYEELALLVKKMYPDGNDTLAIPTWFYGHEPSNAFSSHIAKYFSNSIREDNLLAISLHGVVFCPGSAGTIQEVFADAAQNHYKTYEWVSPMVFFGTEYYQEYLPVKKLIYNLSAGKEYYNMIHFSDSIDDILQFIQSHPPIID